MDTNKRLTKDGFQTREASRLGLLHLLLLTSESFGAIFSKKVRIISIGIAKREGYKSMV